MKDINPEETLTRRELLTAGSAATLSALCPEAAGSDGPPPTERSRKLPERPRFFPVVPTPARKLIVVDIHDIPPDARMLWMSLQGLVNREKPRLYLIPNSRWIGDSTHEPPEQRRDEFWLNWLLKKRFVSEQERVSGDAEGLRALLKRFRTSYKGAVLPDPELPIANNVAITLAGVEDLLVCTPRLASEYGIPVKVDLRGRFSSNHEAMQWVWQTYRDRLNPYLVATTLPQSHESLAWAFSVDYYIQNRAFVFWVTGKESEGKPFCDPAKEKAVVQSILSKLPPNIPVCGFTWAGDGMGLGEWEGVKLISERGNVLVPVGIPNLSVHSGFRIPRLKQRPRRKIPELDKTKVYVTFTTSDGDALLTYYNFYVDWILSSDHGKVPVGLGIGPTAIDLIPTLAAWYYENAAPTDEFFCDVSGIGYMYPEFFAALREGKVRVVADFFRWTSDYMNRMDLQGIRPYGGDRGWMAQYGKQIRNLRYLLPGYGKPANRTPEETEYETASGVPVFPAVTSIVAPNMKQAILEEIRAAAGDRRPAFINAFINVTVNNWSFLYDIPWLAANLGQEFIFVTPGELERLYRTAKR